MEGFERYIELANRSQTPEELFEIFARQLSGYGYDKVLLGLLTDHPSLDMKAGIGVMENYPTDWLKYYFEKKYDQIDPIVTFGAFQTSAFAWSGIGQHVRLHRKQVKCLNLGREAGLNHGISVPLRGPGNALAGISLASSSVHEQPYYAPDMLTAYCQHFYAAYWRLKHKNAFGPRTNAFLTGKEREILTLVALGKQDPDIALILKCSRHSVNHHLRHIFEKLNVDNRILAATKDLHAGLISLPTLS